MDSKGTTGEINDCSGLTEGKCRILHRDTELERINASISPFLKGERPENLVILGRTGTGKTTCIRRITENMPQPYRVVPVYLDCHKEKTLNAILSSIASKLGNPFTSKGFGNHEIFNRIDVLLISEKKRLLLVLDDFDMLPDDEAEGLLHSILGANCSNEVAVILICNKLAVERLDAKIRSSFLFRMIDFRPYTKIELQDILNEKVKLFTEEQAIDIGALEKIAEIGSVVGGDARLTINLLSKSMRFASQRLVNNVQVGDVMQVYAELLPLLTIEMQREGLTEEEALILSILKIGELSSSEIYSLFKKKMDRSKRQIRNYLTSLVSKGYIESKIVETENSLLKPKTFRLAEGD